MPFTLSLTERGLPALIGRPRFRGYVRDDARKGGLPELGRIHGTRHRRRIRFEKSMPISYLADGNGGHVEYRAWLAEQGYTGLPATIDHVIVYSGGLDDTGDNVLGTWHIPAREIHCDQGALETGGGRGTWSARRRSILPTEI